MEAQILLDSAGELIDAATDPNVSVRASLSQLKAAATLLAQRAENTIETGTKTGNYRQMVEALREVVGAATVLASAPLTAETLIPTEQRAEARARESLRRVAKYHSDVYAENIIHRLIATDEQRKILYAAIQRI